MFERFGLCNLTNLILEYEQLMNSKLLVLDKNTSDQYLKFFIVHSPRSQIDNYHNTSNFLCNNLSATSF